MLLWIALIEVELDVDSLPAIAVLVGTWELFDGSLLVVDGGALVPLRADGGSPSAVVTLPDDVLVKPAEAELLGLKSGLSKV